MVITMVSLPIIATLLGLLPLATHSFIVTAPSNDYFWVANTTNTLNWKANHSDADHFTVQLLNTNQSALNGNFEIGNDIPTAQGTADLQLISVPEGTYTVLFVNTSNYQMDQPQVYYQSQPFQVQHNGLAKPAVNPNEDHNPYVENIKDGGIYNSNGEAAAKPAVVPSQVQQSGDNGGGGGSVYNSNGEAAAKPAVTPSQQQQPGNDDNGGGVYNSNGQAAAKPAVTPQQTGGDDGNDDGGVYNSNGQAAAKPAVTPDQVNGQGGDSNSSSVSTESTDGSGSQTPSNPTNVTSTNGASNVTSTNGTASQNASNSSTRPSPGPSTGNIGHAQSPTPLGGTTNVNAAAGPLPLIWAGAAVLVGCAFAFTA